MDRSIEFNPHSIEAEVVSLWKARRLPPTGGVLGPPSGPTVQQFAGSWIPSDFSSLVAHRAVLADVDARYLALVGRRVEGTLRQGTVSGPTLPSMIPALLAALGVWTGGNGRTPWDSEDRTIGIQAIVGRLAAKEILVTRDESFRICPSCGTLRGPECIVYDEQEGDTYLVRFPVRVGERTVHALVWVDAPWKLLGASALLLNPSLRYVVAGYHRREDREVVLTSATSLDRLRSWIPESTFEVVEERPGREFQGTPYSYPLRHEFPMGGDLAPPAGTVLGAADVGDSGTGIVPLVPGHGATDSRIADRLGVTGWPLLTPKGRLDFTLMHKYAGLDLDTANEFVLRDLSEAGALFARLRVKRGVPYCSVCGTALLWAPARAWCLEPSRLPPEARATFSRLLPKEVLPGHAEVAPWPVSEASASEDANSLALLECARCDRLEGPDGPRQCPCGGQRTLVRRRLLPAIGAAFAAWARIDPFPEGDSVHLYVGHRRRVPSLVHHLAALTGIEGTVTDVSLTLVPTVGLADAPELVAKYGADVVRAALVRSGLSESVGGCFEDQCRRESDRIHRWWSLSHEVLSMCDFAMVAAFARPIGGFLGELEVEDRAIVARWERTRVLALAHYDHSAPGLVYRRVSQFLDTDLVGYRELVESRLALEGTPPAKRGALRTLVHLLRGISEVLAPIVPFTSEAVHRSLSSERTSLFEQPTAGLDRSLLNDDLVAAWDRWRTVLRSVDRFRRSLGVPRSTGLPSLVLVVPADDVGDRLRAEKEALARLAGVQRLEVASPREPWTGRQRLLRPIESEIQKVYPAQASQIVHLLQRMPPRRGTGTGGEEEISVVVEGYPLRVFPTMVTFVDTLPTRVVPFPWSLGEMYIELPAGTEVRQPPAPPLSPDAFWLVRRIERRLRASPPEPGQVPRIALVTVKDPLASELRAVAEPVARHLGLGELRVVEKSEEAIPPNALTGRTRTGDRWWVDVPGLPAPRTREKHPRSGARLPRVVTVELTEETEAIDYLDEKFVAHEEAIRALGQELDGIVGTPLLSPAKIAVAWDHGLHSVDDLRRSSFEAISALPGFGRPVAEVVVSKIGGTVPAREAHRKRRGLATTRPAPATLPVAGTGPTPSVEATEEPVLPGPSPPALAPSPPPAEVVERPPSPGPEEPATAPLPEQLPPVILPPALPIPSVSETQAEVRPPPEPPIATTEAAEPVAPSVSEPLGGAPEVAEEPMPAPLEEPKAPEEGLPPEEPRQPSEPALSEEPAPPGEAAEAARWAPVMKAAPPEESTALPLETPPAEPALPPPEENVPPVEGPPPPPSSEPELPPGGEVLPAAEEPTVSETVEPSPAPESLAPGPILREEAVGSPLPEVEPPVLSPPEEAQPVIEPAPEMAEPIPPPAETGTPPEGETLPPSGEVPVAETPGSVPTPEAPVEVGAPGNEPAEVPSPLSEPSTPSSPVEVPSVTGPPVEGLPPSPPPAEPRPERIVEGPTALPPAPTAPVITFQPPSAPIPPEAEPPLPPSGVELIIGDSLVTALGGFLDSTAAGHHGVCVVRESPERIRARVGSRPIEVFWLTNIGRGPSLRPSDLEGVWAFLGRKLLEEHVTAFFLEGVEYLVRLHGAEAVLTGLVQFDRVARESDARVWVCLTPALMKPTDIERFHATFGSGPATS